MAAWLLSSRTWPRTLARGDGNYLALLNAADAYIDHNGLDLPEEPEARMTFPDPDYVTRQLLELDLAKVGVTSIILATGFATDYSWLNVDEFGDKGKPQHQRGVSSEPGVYFLGLPSQSRHGSSFIWGVWHDAKYVDDHIAIQRSHLDYHDAAQRGLIMPPGCPYNHGQCLSLFLFMSFICPRQSVRSR